LIIFPLALVVASIAKVSGQNGCQVSRPKFHWEKTVGSYIIPNPTYPSNHLKYIIQRK
jgi:hypothetical protein